jgi:hypothetical protein
VTAVCLVLPLALLAGIWGSQPGHAGSAALVPRLLVASLCSVAGLAFLVRAAAGARRRDVAGEVTFQQFQTGVVGLLKDRYVRGELLLAEYEAYLNRVLQPARRLDAAGVPVRLTLLPDAPRRSLSLAGAGGALMLAAGLSLAGPGIGPTSGAGAPRHALGTIPVALAAPGPAPLAAPVSPADGCPAWPPGHRQQCRRWYAPAGQAAPPSARAPSSAHREIAQRIPVLLRR